MKINNLIFGVLGILILSNCIIKDESGKNVSNTIKTQSSNFFGRGSKANNSASEAIITFNYAVEIISPEISLDKPEKEIRDAVYKRILKQINHLFGSLHAHNYKGAIKPARRNKVKLDLKNLQYDQKQKKLTIAYQYKGTALLDNEIGTSISLPIPRNPDTIYKASKADKSVNPCTDPHYNSAGDFWYFWNPKNSGCNSIKEGKDYDSVQINVQRMSNTQHTYPDYKRLIRQDNIIPIYFFLGYTSPKVSVDDNFMNIDAINRDGLNYTTNKLLAMGFNQINKKVRRTNSSFLYKYERKDSQTGITYLVNFFIGNTENIDTPDAGPKDFHLIYKEALEQGAVIYYAGHSGLGGNLNINLMKQNNGSVSINRENYQILFFNSCSSYPYYTDHYFEQKRGTMKPDGKIDDNGTYNFDIITNGLSSFTAVNTLSFTSFLDIIIDAFEAQKVLSYQEIIGQLHSEQMKANPGGDGHMINVSGDEDNPTEAPNLE